MHERLNAGTYVPYIQYRGNAPADSLVYGMTSGIRHDVRGHERLNAGDVRTYDTYRGNAPADSLVYGMTYLVYGKTYGDIHIYRRNHHANR